MWIDVARAFLVWVIPAVLLLVMRRETSRNRAAKETGEGTIVFELDQLTYWAWLGLFVYLLYAIVIQFGGGPFRMVSVWVSLLLAAIALGLMLPFPETISVGPDGVVQEIRFWLKKKKMSWGDVREIRLEKKSRLLIVEGADGTKIVHTRQLPDRDRLLEELYKHCGEKVPVELRPVAAVVKDLAHEAAVVDPIVSADPAVEG